MKKVAVVALLLGFALLGTAQTRKCAGDDAIKRVENCVCYRSVDGQRVKTWEIDWGNSDKLRSQISHCVCQAHIDVSGVENPGRYVFPGTLVK